MPAGSSDIICLVWLLFISWEVAGPKTAFAHNVLVPSPENVFNVFVEHGPELALNVVSSLQLLLTGFVLGTLLGVILGVGIVIVQMLLDDRYRTAEEIRRYAGLATLGVVPVEGEDDVRAGRSRRKA